MADKSVMGNVAEDPKGQRLVTLGLPYKRDHWRPKAAWVTGATGEKRTPESSQGENIVIYTLKTVENNENQVNVDSPFSLFPGDHRANNLPWE